MISQEEKKIVPGHEHGVDTDTESSVTFEKEEDAKKHFGVARERLLNVSQWREISKAGPSDFQIVDNAGNEVTRPVKEGDYFKIDIQAPGSDSGDGYDWVHIVQILDEKAPERGFELTAMKVKPSKNPLKKDENTSHFFDDQASSTFVVKREGLKITAVVHGRNESPNTETENLADKIRNAVIALGAMLGFSKAQWKSLVEGIVEK